MMFAADCLDVNEQGWLTIGGVSAEALAKEFGTPLYVMDEEQIRRKCRAYKEAIAQIGRAHV